MEPSNRIPELSITPTVERQTPRNEFGEVLARTLGEGVMSAARAVSGGHPLAKALGAIPELLRNGASAAGVHAASYVPPGQGGVHGSAPVSAGATSAGGGTGATEKGGSGWDLLDAQRALQAESQQFQVQYLQLQNEMQRESREYNAISNVMKVRHDSAKAAINNIR